MAKPKTTQRAYTFRLRGNDPKNQSWREYLWRTHEAINKGAKVFGDWLLTLRGGLDHAMAEEKVRTGSGSPDRDPTPAERASRRILLALSWLSVESEHGAPQDYIVASGKEDAKSRSAKVIAAFRKILEGRGLAEREIEEWMSDCSASLSAAIREDAVWVNRSQRFDDEAKKIGPSLTREEAWETLGRFLGSREIYLGGESEETKEKECIQQANLWLSNRFGTGKGTEFHQLANAYRAIATWVESASPGPGVAAIASLAAALNARTRDLKGVLACVSGPGHKSATRNLLAAMFKSPEVTREDLDKLKKAATEDAAKCETSTKTKGRRAYCDAILRDVENACGFTFLTNTDGTPVPITDYYRYGPEHIWGAANQAAFSVMLDHAAQRVPQAHSWVKRAERERCKLAVEAAKLDQVPASARVWLDTFCEKRSETLGAIEPYRIRRRAVTGWGEVVAKWNQSGSTKEDRIAAVKALQRNAEAGKFGDVQLFEALADDEAASVWRGDGDSATVAQTLIDYVLATEARAKQLRYKVPMYRHPDPLLHPVWCEFGTSRLRIEYAIHADRTTRDPKGISLRLWTGSEMRETTLRWESKRLKADMGLNEEPGGESAINVTRADRLGRAAAEAKRGAAVRVAEIFEHNWNGRLQASREQLEKIAAIRDNPHLAPKERAKQMAEMIDYLRWSMSVSMKVRPQGPWPRYVETHGIDGNPWQLALSRLPGLRVLSVDLSHRYGAACVVWETADAKQVEADCRSVGYKQPKASDLYLHLADTKGKPSLYRRIGADKLPDGTPHPSPWARMDRQFLIKLQGEDKETREVSNEELLAVHRLETELGRNVPIIDRLVRAGWGGSEKQKKRLEVLKHLGWRPTKGSGADVEDEDDDAFDMPSLKVDELMFSVVRDMRLALKRHGDRARIAFAMTADHAILPGNRRYWFHEAKELSIGDDEETRRTKHREVIQDSLARWYDLAMSAKWRDEWAGDQWENYIASLPGYQEPKRGNKESFRAAAEALLQDAERRASIHEAWKRRWEEDDSLWRKRLQWCRRWLTKGVSEDDGKTHNRATIHRVGGLSLTRIATLTEFRNRVQMAFFSRLRPDGTRVPISERFGQRMLGQIERLREQRSKQLASRIVEAALGIGRMNQPAKERDRQRPDVQVDKPCHVIAIEDLTNYRPEETRARLENRRIMTLAAARMQKYLFELCQLHGLHLREIQAHYTSRQDSRTGAPGVRCREVAVADFMRSRFWRKETKRAQAKRCERKADARDRFLCELEAKWKSKDATEWRKAGSVWIPLQGGELFVSVAPDQKVSIKNAYLNAAANIGLRALLDADWSGKWWYVPCERSTGRPARDLVKDSAAIDPDVPLRRMENGSAATRRGRARSGRQTGGVVNLWRDVSSREVSAANGPWEEHAQYWERVMDQICEALVRHQKA